MTIGQTANAYGYRYDFIEGACKRGANEHPLPHIKRGESRAIRYIQPATFEKWLAEEERRTVGLPDEEAKENLHIVLERIWKEYREFENAIDEFQEELSA